MKDDTEKGVILVVDDEVRLLEGPEGVASFLSELRTPILPVGFGNLLIWLKSQDHKLYGNVLDTLPERYGVRYGV